MKKADILKELDRITYIHGPEDLPEGYELEDGQTLKSVNLVYDRHGIYCWQVLAEDYRDLLKAGGIKARDINKLKNVESLDYWDLVNDVQNAFALDGWHLTQDGDIRVEKIFESELFRHLSRWMEPATV